MSLTWLDLTRPLVDGMGVYPGDPAVALSPALTLADDGVAVLRLDLGTHTGTHVDAPAHTQHGGRTVDALTRDELCGPTFVLGLTGLSPSEEIPGARLDALLPHGDLPPRVLIATGWDARFADDAAREAHPFLSAEAARLLWRRGVRLIGVDTLSPDRTVPTDGSDSPGAPVSPADDAAPAFPVHARFLSGDGVIVENLTGLDALRPSSASPDADWCAAVEMEAHPLPIAGGDGAPARVWARPLPTPEDAA